MLNHGEKVGETPPHHTRPVDGSWNRIQERRHLLTAASTSQRDIEHRRMRRRTLRNLVVGPRDGLLDVQPSAANADAEAFGLVLKVVHCLVCPGRETSDFYANGHHDQPPEGPAQPVRRLLRRACASREPEADGDGEQAGDGHRPHRHAAPF